MFVRALPRKKYKNFHFLFIQEIEKQIIHFRSENITHTVNFPGNSQRTEGFYSNFGSVLFFSAQRNFKAGPPRTCLRSSSNPQSCSKSKQLFKIETAAQNRKSCSKSKELFKIERAAQNRWSCSKSLELFLTITFFFSLCHRAEPAKRVNFASPLNPIPPYSSEQDTIERYLTSKHAIFKNWPILTFFVETS